jgi:PPM family protein phosphatase
VWRKGSWYRWLDLLLDSENPMPWECAYAAASYRTDSEDRTGFWRTKYGHLIMVADGMGGRRGGAIASEFVLTGVAAYAKWPAFPSPQALCNLFRQIDLDSVKVPGMGETTGAVCALSDRGISGAAVGDSATWWVTGNTLSILTTEAYPKPWLGSGIAKPIPFFAPDEPGTLLLMTDGVWKYAPQDLLIEWARTLEVSALPAKFIDAAKLRSGQLQDDAAIVAARFVPSDT